MKAKLTQYANLGLFALYAEVMGELLRRDIIHSSRTSGYSLPSGGSAQVGCVFGQRTATLLALTDRRHREGSAARTCQRSWRRSVRQALVHVYDENTRVVIEEV